MQRRSSAVRADSLPSVPSHHLGVVLAVDGRACEVDCDGTVLHAVLAPHLPLVQPSQRVAVLQVEGVQPLILASWPDEQSSTEPLFEHDRKTGTLSINATRLKLAGVASVELACGDARLSISLDGRVEILGNEIVSAAVGAHRIEGASIDLN
jgi:hypothetical protein